ncbi:MAG: AAA family ATPase [Labilithrix sp.]|nr:AAA family ATPase [Labilithrix sp.]MCW5812799.1 AAA family ATPase [Labilithrix sp.]
MQFDPREAGRVVASVLLAAPVTPQLVKQANDALVRLQLAPLSERDSVVSTPEELAGLIPPHLRDALADLCLEIAGNDQVRRRVALAYVHLWGRQHSNQHASEHPRAAHLGEKVARAVIGQLPQHQNGGHIAPDAERPVQESAYRGRGPDGRPRSAPPPLPVDPLRVRVQRIAKEMDAVIHAIDRVVIGKRDVVARVLVAMAARGHVLFVDIPGVGKTLLCKTIASALGIGYGRVQLTPDLMPMDVTGSTTYDPQAAKFHFRPGPVFTNILLADEINRATPKTQSALLEVMEERTVTIDGTTHKMADPFQVLATMNPFDHDGTYPLPAAQIDRFMSLLELGVPSIDDEIRVLDTHLAESHGAAPIAPVVTSETFVEWQRTVPQIHASPDVKRAAVLYIDALRKTVPSGNSVSPRATIAWMRCAQARAMLAGREFVTVEDLLDVAPEVLRHRLWISPPEIRDRLRALSTPR